MEYVILGAIIGALIVVCFILFCIIKALHQIAKNQQIIVDHYLTLIIKELTKTEQ